MSVLSTCLRLRDYGVFAGSKPLLADIDLTVPSRGIVLVMGPAGAGKSTLLRSISGEFDPTTSYRLVGTAVYRNGPRAPGNSPHLVRQRLSLVTTTIEHYLISAHPNHDSFVPMEHSFHMNASLTELDGFGFEDLWAERLKPVLELSAFDRKRLALARSVVANASLVCLDEIFRDTNEAEALELRNMVLRMSEHRAVLLVTHHRKHALALGGDALFLAGGRLWARQATAHFFESPINELVKRFVRTGGCPIPSLAAREEDVGEEYRQYIHPAALGHPAKSAGGLPTGFRWAIQGKLAGFGRAGFLAEAADEIAAIAAAGVTHVVCLEEELPMPNESWSAAGVTLEHFPVPDMAAPDLAAAVQLARRVEAGIERGEVWGYSCRAGIGRTGTMLAVHRIVGGETAQTAIAALRVRNPLYVQSDAQSRFLEQAARRLLEGDEK